jgi:membrane protein required for colicin V production
LLFDFDQSITRASTKMISLSLTVFDWIFIGILVLSCMIGAWRGLVYEVLSVFVWLAAFVLAQLYAPDVAEKLPMAGAVQSLRYAAAFILVFIGAAFVAGLITQMIKKLVTAVGLRAVDRTLGAVFGLLRGGILLLAITVVVNMTQMRSHAEWQASQGGALLTQMLTNLKPLLPQEFGKYLP